MNLKSITKSAANLAVGAALTTGFAASANAVTYMWNGGSAGRWCEAANWLADGAAAATWPSTTSDRVEFAADSTATVDLGAAELTVGLLQVKANATVEIKNGTLNFGAPSHSSSDANVLAGARLKLNAVTATVRKLSGSHIDLLYGAKAWLELANGTTLTLPSCATLPNAGGGGFVLNDSTLASQGEIYLGYESGTTRTGSKVVDSIFATNSTVTVAPNFWICWGGCDLLLKDSQMTVGGPVLFRQLHNNNGYANPVVTIDGESTLTAQGIGYREWYDLGEKWVFNVVSDKPVVNLTGNSEKIGTGLSHPYLVVNAPEGWQRKYPTGVTVPLFACAGTFGVPSVWQTADPSRVTLAEDVGALTYDSLVGRLVATFPSKGRPEPSALIVVDPAPASASAISVAASVQTVGDGGASYGVMAKLYADADRTELLQTKVLAEDATEVPTTYRAVFDGLTLDQHYYGTFEVTNDLGAKGTADFDMVLALPEQVGDDYSWKGWGDGTSFTDPYNWGIRAGWPSNASANVVFGVDVHATVDLAGAAVTNGLMNMYRGCDVTFVNGTYALRDILQVSVPIGSGSNRLCFDGVYFTRLANRHFAYGQFTESPFYLESYAGSCALEFINRSTLDLTPAGGNGLFLFGSSKGRYLFQDSTAKLASVMPGEWGAVNSSGAFLNSTVEGTGILRAKAYDGGMVLSNAVFRGFSTTSTDSSQQMMLEGNGTELWGATSVSAAVPQGRPFLLDAHNKPLTVGATGEGFPTIAVTGKMTLQSVNRLKLVIPADGSAGRPKRGVWTILSASDGLSLPSTWTTCTLDQCGSFCDIVGFKKPSRYTLLVGSNRVALQCPGTGTMILVY